MGRLLKKLKADESSIIDDEEELEETFEDMEVGLDDTMPLQTYAKLDDEEVVEVQEHLIDKIINYISADADWLDLNGHSTWKCRYCGFLEKEPQLMKEHIITSHNDKVQEWFPDELIWKGTQLARQKDNADYYIQEDNKVLRLCMSLDMYDIKRLKQEQLRLVVDTGKASKDRLFVHNNEYYFKEPEEEDSGDGKYLMYSLNIGAKNLGEKLKELHKDKQADDYRIKVNSNGNFAVYYKEKEGKTD